MPNPAECRYAQSHEWIHVKDGVGTVGVSEHAQGEITDVVFVELPKSGRKVKQKEACAVVESVKAAFDIYAPVSGEITEVNEAVVNDPSIVNSSPHEDGWLYKIKLDSEAELEALMDHDKYQEFSKSAASH